MSYRGEGGQQDYSQAKRWFEKSANQGYAVAQHNLGVMYKNGEGGRQDYGLAKEWYGKSCDNGYRPGCESYKNLNGKGF